MNHWISIFAAGQCRQGNRRGFVPFFFYDAANRVKRPHPLSLASGILTLHTQVNRIAPAATLAEKATQSTVTVYCPLDNTDGTLRSGMTGFGRIHHQMRPLGLIALDRVQRYLRTEFGW